MTDLPKCPCCGREMDGSEIYFSPRYGGIQYCAAYACRLVVQRAYYCPTRKRPVVFTDAEIREAQEDRTDPYYEEEYDEEEEHEEEEEEEEEEEGE